MTEGYLNSLTIAKHHCLDYIGGVMDCVLHYPCMHLYRRSGQGHGEGGWPAWSGVDGFLVVSLLCKTELYIVYRLSLASVGRCCTATGRKGGLLTSKQT